MHFEGSAIYRRIASEYYSVSPVGFKGETEEQTGDRRLYTLELGVSCLSARPVVGFTSYSYPQLVSALHLIVSDGPVQSA